jgi:hypothetical protein
MVFFDTGFAFSSPEAAASLDEDASPEEDKRTHFQGRTVDAQKGINL